MQRGIIESTSAITAGFISIDRFLRRELRFCCLPFDRIGARHPGVTLGPGVRSPGQNLSPLSDRSRKPTKYPWHELGVADDPADRKPNGKTGFPAYLRPTSEPVDAPMPGCRTPIRSKGKQQNRSSILRKRSIEMKPAVIVDVDSIIPRCIRKI